MIQSFDIPDHQWSRAAAAIDITVLALKRGASHMALAAVREAARSALLAFAGAPRRLAGADLEMLRSIAASSPQHLAGRPTERQARIRAVLVILNRLFPQPPADDAMSGWESDGSGSSGSPGPLPVCATAGDGVAGVFDPGNRPAGADASRNTLTGERMWSWT